MTEIGKTAWFKNGWKCSKVLNKIKRYINEFKRRDLYLNIFPTALNIRKQKRWQNIQDYWYPIKYVFCLLISVP